MIPFNTLHAIAAPLPIANIDTDQLVAARFLKTVSREGLGSALLHAMRFDETGAPRPDFILNRTPWRDAKILVALDNFGCGSSREHAPWALVDYGFRAIIAPSFADIFRNNCLQNGVLPIAIARGACINLLERISDPAAAMVRISLPDQTIESPGFHAQFEIDPRDKARLLQGRDQLDETLALADALAAYENALAPAPLADHPWR